MTQEQKTRLNPEEMLARINELAEKPEISAKEFGEFVDLIWDKACEDSEADRDQVNFVYLPIEEVEAKILIERYSDSSFTGITLVDGLDHINRWFPTGERVVGEEENGELVWKVAVLDSVYSEFLGKRIMLDGIDEALKSTDPLNPSDLARLAMLMRDSYPVSAEKL
ncbi:MAG: hypothetical protein AABX59_01655 [Nanoarchaeota archaeon]